MKRSSTALVVAADEDQMVIVPLLSRFAVSWV